MMLAVALMAVSTVSGEEPTFQYISCVKAEVARLRESGQGDEVVADMAVANCEELVAGAAQASVDETPPEVLAAYEESGITAAQFLERQTEIARHAARDMALYILEEEQKDQSS